MTTKLPCPFCGSINIEVNRNLRSGYMSYPNDRQYVFQCMCENCGARTNKEGETQDEAINIWNTRPDQT